MKSERAYDFIQRRLTTDGYLTSESAEMAVEIAEQEAEDRVLAELTRWHDANDMPILIPVLVEMYCGEFRVVIKQRNGDIEGLPPYDSTIVGWRRIHE